MLAPFLPHITEEIYMNTYQPYEKDESIHVSPWPLPPKIDDAGLEDGILIKENISLIRAWKSGQGIALNAPIGRVEISGNSAKRLGPYHDLIKSTLNIKDLKIPSAIPDIEEQVSIKPDFSRIGKKFQSKTPIVLQEIKKHEKEIVKTIDEQGNYTLTSVPPAGNAILDKDDVKIERKLKSKKGNIDVIKYKDVFISLEK
jgi:valyl-tRNA synthetase